MSILSVKNVTKSYGKNQVLKDITFSLEEPGIKALIGPNGSGKTTLFSVITNLLKKDSGEIKILGMENDNPQIFKKISFLKDNTVLYSYLSGLDHLKFIAHAQGLPSSRIDEVCESIGISGYVRNKTGTYSLGMKQHLLLTMAIMNNPKLMILDEPLNGLDPTSVIKIRTLLQQLAEDGAAILLSSHTLSEIDFLTSDILFLSKGKIIKEDISIYKTIEYDFLLKEESLGKAEMVFKNEENVIIRATKLTYRTESSDVQSFIRYMTESGIEFIEMSNRKIGAEERYKAIFPEEFVTMESGLGDII